MREIGLPHADLTLLSTGVCRYRHGLDAGVLCLWLWPTHNPAGSNHGSASRSFRSSIVQRPCSGWSAKARLFTAIQAASSAPTWNGRSWTPGWQHRLGERLGERPGHLQQHPSAFEPHAAGQRGGGRVDAVRPQPQPPVLHGERGLDEPTADAPEPMRGVDAPALPRRPRHGRIRRACRRPGQARGAPPRTPPERRWSTVCSESGSMPSAATAAWASASTSPTWSAASAGTTSSWTSTIPRRYRGGSGPWRAPGGDARSRAARRW